MTWSDLRARLRDPIIVGGLILLVVGELQAQSQMIVEWLGPVWSGRVLSLIGIIGAVARWMQTQPSDPRRLESAARDHTGTDDVA